VRLKKVVRKFRENWLPFGRGGSFRFATALRLSLVNLRFKVLNTTDLSLQKLSIYRHS